MKYLIEDIKRWYRDDETGMIWIGTIFAVIFACLMINDTWIHPHPGVDYVLFSNDGPLGVVNADESKPNLRWGWYDLNGIGQFNGQFNASLSTLLLTTMLCAVPQALAILAAHAIPGFIVAFFIRRCRYKLRWQIIGFVLGIIVFAHLVNMFIILSLFIVFAAILAMAVSLLDRACQAK